MNDNFDLGDGGIPNLDTETRKLIRETHTETDDNSERIRKLESKLNNLSLVTEGLWALLNKRTKLTNEELATSIQEVAQARRTREESKLICVKCRMQSSINHKKCMYCGGELTGHTEKSLFNF